MCLAKDCTAPEQTFATRHEWIAHEQGHQTQWHCVLCTKPATGRQRMEQHLIEHHPEAEHESQIEKLVNMSEQTSISISAVKFVCPLCQMSLESHRAYQTHVGHHQQDLSMFALPSLPPEFVDEDENLDPDQDDLGSTSSNEAVSERDFDSFQEPEIAGENLHEPSTKIIKNHSEVIDEHIKQGNRDWDWACDGCDSKVSRSPTLLMFPLSIGRLTSSSLSTMMGTNNSNVCAARTPSISAKTV